MLRAAHRAIVAAAGAYGVRLIDDFITNPYPAASIGGLPALRAYYERELAKAKEGITEIFLHPALPDEALLKRTPEWQKRVWEYAYLSSDAWVSFLEREGFTLCSWANAPFDKRKKQTR